MQTTAKLNKISKKNICKFCSIYTCISKSGSLNSRAEATDATDALDTDSSEEEDVASAGAWDLDLRLPPFLPRFTQQGTLKSKVTSVLD